MATVDPEPTSIPPFPAPTGAEAPASVLPATAPATSPEAMPGLSPSAAAPSAATVIAPELASMPESELPALTPLQFSQAPAVQAKAPPSESDSPPNGDDFDAHPGNNVEPPPVQAVQFPGQSSSTAVETPPQVTEAVTLAPLGRPVEDQVPGEELEHHSPDQGSPIDKAGAPSEPAPSNDGTEQKRRRSKAKIRRQYAHGRAKSAGLPPLVKVALLALLLALIGVAAIKVWPQAQSKPKGSNIPPASPMTQPPPDDPGSAGEDPSGFRYLDEPAPEPGSINTQAITPQPETKYKPAPIRASDPESSTASSLLDPIDLDPLAEPAKPIVTSPEEPGEEEDPDAVQAKARAALDRILEAETVDELAELVLAPERVVPKMHAQYGERSPKITPTRVIYELSAPIEDSEILHHRFFIATEQQPMQFPIVLEETDEGIKLDWESFIELHDDLLGTFLSSPTEQPQTFRAILRRSHYFGTDVPKLGSKDCFRISTPIPGKDGYAFVDKDSSVADSCKPFSWEVVAFPMITLKWTTPDGGEPYLEITRIDQMNWRAKGD